MRAVLQRVSHARVITENNVVGEISAGWLVYLAIHIDDDQKDLDYLINKTIHLRCFCDNEGKMNHSILDSGGAILVVSQFTLYGDCRKGRRPSFTHSAPPEHAEKLYFRFCAALGEQGLTVATGQFQAHMMVESINDGPVTVILDSSKIM